MTHHTAQTGSSASDSDGNLTETQRVALMYARELALAGVPIFTAPADPSATEGFKLPTGWQRSEAYAASIAAIERWRPGDALCAVGGHAVDFLDVDPRNGGLDSAVQLQAGDAWPRTFGETATPSDGRHHLIMPLAIGKHQGKGPILGGLDLQGGRLDGTGRGFVFLPPTVRKSKATGAMVPYAWIAAPDMTGLAEWAGVDDSGNQLATLIRAAQSVHAEPAQDRPALPSADPFPGDPFAAPGRVFDDRQAREFVGPMLDRFAAMTDDDHGFNDALNKLACAYSHFVPAFLNEADAIAVMLAAAIKNGSVRHQGEPAVRRTILSGLRQTGDPWKAVRADPSGAPDAALSSTGTGADQGGQVGDSSGTGDGDSGRPPFKSRAERLRSLLYVRSALDSIPPPTPLITGVLDVATIAVLAGKFGTYKSFVALSWACSIATGRPWFGREVPEARPVLYVAAEGVSGMNRRIGAWEQGCNDGERVADDRLVVLGGAANLTVAEDMRTLDAIAHEIGAGLIVLDTLHRCAPGAEENSSKDMGEVIEMMALLRERTGATMLACHHTGHAGVRSRGSSSIEDDADTSWVIRLAEDDGEDRSAANPRTMYHRKTKDGELSPEVPLELVKVGDDAYVREVVIGDGFSAAGSVWLGARELAVIMDDLKVPMAAGREKVGKILRGDHAPHGQCDGSRHPVRNDQLSEAIKLRKSGALALQAPSVVPLPVGDTE